MDIDDPPVDFVGLARSMGVDATLVEKADDVGDAVAAALEAGRPHLLEMPIAAPVTDAHASASTCGASASSSTASSSLDGIDWRVDAGERWVVLGRNGSGKTTLVRIASLYLHPSRGDVEVLGERARAGRHPQGADRASGSRQRVARRPCCGADARARSTW